MCVICRKEYSEETVALKLDQCPEVTEIPALPKLKYLSIHDCRKLRELPAELPALIELDCTKYFGFTIPEYATVKNLWIAYCPNLIEIPNCPLVESVLLEGLVADPDQGGYEVPEWQYLKHLHILEAPIWELPNLPALITLHWPEALITELPLLPKLEKLYLEESQDLSWLGDLPQLREARVSHCHDLIEITDLPKLYKLEVSCCDKLERILACPNLEEIEVQFCPKLIISDVKITNSGHDINVAFNPFSYSYEDKVAKLIKLQRQYRKKLLLKYLESEEFNNWLYAPDGIGAKWVSRHFASKQ